MFKFKLHSVVDVITNSSTVIYTYQNGSVEPAKELINEMLKLVGTTDKTADDLFYFAVLPDEERLLDRIPDNDENVEIPTIKGNWGSSEFDESKKYRNEWLSSYIETVIINGEIPDWMDIEECEESSYLYIISKEKQYDEFAKKIGALLGSVYAEEGYN